MRNGKQMFASCEESNNPQNVSRTCQRCHTCGAQTDETRRNSSCLQLQSCGFVLQTDYTFVNHPATRVPTWAFVVRLTFKPFSFPPWGASSSTGGGMTSVSLNHPRGVQHFVCVCCSWAEIPGCNVE